MKKFLLLIIVVLFGIIMHQGGCFDNFDFYYGSKMMRILEGKTK